MYDALALLHAQLWMKWWIIIFWIIFNLGLRTAKVNTTYVTFSMLFSRMWIWKELETVDICLRSCKSSSLFQCGVYFLSPIF